MKSVYNYHKNWDLEVVNKAVNKEFPDFELDKIEIHPGTQCQLRCPWCYGRSLRKKKKEVPLRIYIDNVIECLENKPVIMIGGLYTEPLLYSEITGIFHAIAGKALRYGLYTNGLALTDEIIHSMNSAAFYNQDSFISLDISASLQVDRLGEVLDSIKKIKKQGLVQVNAPVLLSDEIIPFIKEIHKDLKDAGVDNIRYSVPQAPINPKYDVVRELQDDQTYIELTYKTNKNCYIMTNSLSIAPDGNVYPCSQVCSDNFKDLIIDNIILNKITDIWHSAEHYEMFKSFDPSKSICRCNRIDGKFNTICESFK